MKKYMLYLFEGWSELYMIMKNAKRNWRNTIDYLDKYYKIILYRSELYY